MSGTAILSPAREIGSGQDATPALSHVNITDLTRENMQDLVAALFDHAGHTNATIEYDDAGNVINITATAAGGGASQLDELSDVTTATPTANNILVADGSAFNSTVLTKALITDFDDADYLASDALTGYATESYVDTAVTGLATETYVDTAVTGLATETYVDTAVAGVSLDWSQTQQSTVADSGSAVAFAFDTSVSMSLGKLASWRNNGTELFALDADGALVIDGAATPRIQIGNTQEAYIDFSTNNIYKGLNFRRGTTNVLSLTGTQIVAYQTIASKTPANDSAPPNLTIQAAHARYNASVNTDGANLVLMGGNGRTTGDGDAGDIILRSGTPGGAGANGLVIIEDLPTSDPAVTGALWNDSGTLKIS